MKTKNLSIKNSNILNLLKGTLAAVSTTLILILLFALLIRFFDISDSWIFPVNQVIKVISLFVGIISTIKLDSKNGFLKGLLLAISYFLLSYIVFSILQGRLAFALTNLYDFLITALMGGIIGIIVVNIKRKN